MFWHFIWRGEFFLSGMNSEIIRFILRPSYFIFRIQHVIKTQRSTESENEWKNFTTNRISKPKQGTLDKILRMFNRAGRSLNRATGKPIYSYSILEKKLNIKNKIMIKIIKYTNRKCTCLNSSITNVNLLYSVLSGHWHNLYHLSVLSQIIAYCSYHLLSTIQSIFCVSFIFYSSISSHTFFR